MFKNKQLVGSKLLTVLFLVGSTPSFAYEIPSSKKLVESDDTEVLQRISKAVSSIASAANKALVFVSVSKSVKGMPFGSVNPFEFFFGPGFPGPRGGNNGGAPEQKKQQGLGSGFFIDLDKGYILTNNHVIDGADEISVKLSNGESHVAKVVGRDKNTDVAVVQITSSKFSRKKLGILTLGNSADVKVGDFSVALGAPFGLEASVSFGVVSALGRSDLNITELGSFIQTDAAINPGNSGGPLLNVYGEVIGINTAIYSKSGGYNGIGFAIPSNIVRRISQQLIDSGKVTRGFLGVGLSRGLDPEIAKDMGLPDGVSGALVSAVEPGGPADKAGFEAGDIIVELEGKSVRSDSDLRARIGLMKPGKSVSMTIFRSGKKKSIKATLTTFPGAKDPSAEPEEATKGTTAPYGLSLAPLTRELRQNFDIKARKGVVITAISPNSSADRAGLMAGDVITKVNNQIVSTPTEFNKIVKNQNRIYLRIFRDDRELFVPLRK